MQGEPEDSWMGIFMALDLALLFVPRGRKGLEYKLKGPWLVQDAACNSRAVAFQSEFAYTPVKRNQKNKPFRKVCFDRK
ncbi:Hypothetical protein NTJ_01922 [Nesidiocoris tenuis]|uniref:Uncharacterized protein n=1 Tax=Nesidiocoris tenuis TaxID=355587 RepID=A0ABN7AE25_9HEMI|nr:Hypothetical protein NTJ_01922 [Nesidiocoris tenuis]